MLFLKNVMSDIEIRAGKRPFTDVLHFPRGFSRSGDFSIADSNLLTQYGDTLALLANGDIEPENKQEQHFVDVCTGDVEPETKLEFVWLKYLNKTRRRQFYTLCGSERGAQLAAQDVGDAVLDMED